MPKIKPFQPTPISLHELGLGQSGFEEKLDTILSQSTFSPQWKPSGFNKASYLDMIEHIVRHSLKHWINEDGSGYDEQDDKTFTPMRLAPAAAFLLKKGRVQDFRNKIFKVMDYSCAAFSDGKLTANFAVNELALAYGWLKPLADKQRSSTWHKALSHF